MQAALWHIIPLQCLSTPMHQALPSQAFTFSTPAPSAPVPTEPSFTDWLGGKSLQEVAEDGSINSQLMVGHGRCALPGTMRPGCTAGLPNYGVPYCTVNRDDVVTGPISNSRGPNIKYSSRVVQFINMWTFQNFCHAGQAHPRAHSALQSQWLFSYDVAAGRLKHIGWLRWRPGNLRATRLLRRCS